MFFKRICDVWDEISRSFTRNWRKTFCAFVLEEANDGF
jgi:hypothetical protein